MDSDLLLVMGCLFMVLSVPSAVAALSDGRAPLLALSLLIAGVAFVVMAVVGQPGGYRLGQLPDVFFRVIARFVH